MNILVITDDFYPNKAGIAHTITTLCKYFRKREHKLYIVNPYYKAKNVFNIFEQKTYKLIDFLRFFGNKKNLYTLLLSITKIFQDKKIKLFYRINLILYLFTKPIIFRLS